MFQGFRINSDESYSLNELLYYYSDVIDETRKSYNDFCNEHYQKIESGLKQFIRNGILSASEITSGYFPEVEADVFLSHSHQDEKFITDFAVWLYSMDIRAFIDSRVWHNCKDLLKDIDDDYCRLDYNLYSYEKCRNSASHVYILLNSALIHMIDSTECFIFTGTANSLAMKLKNIEEGTYPTYSPWIYSEISASKTIRRQKPLRLENYAALGDILLEGKVPVAKDELKIKYDLELEHLLELNTEDLIYIKDSGSTGKKALDELYRKKKVITGREV